MNKLIFKNLGLQNYLKTLNAMKLFTNQRNEKSLDEVWFCEHPEIFTVGCRNTDNHILKKIKSIPIVKTDRGGLITYHAPGQIMMYVLFDLRRNNIGIRHLVDLLQEIVIDSLKELEIESYGDDSRPGVFVKLENNQEAKICSIGLRISKGKSYHGLCLNFDMDLSPFKLINPCGFKGLKMVNIREISPISLSSINQVIDLLKVKIIEKLKRKTNETI